MSDSLGKPWNNNPNTPQIPYVLYVVEKAYFAGVLIGAIGYGVVIVLFFQCIGALLNPANRMKEGVRWGLVAHTTAMLSCLTIPAAMHFNFQCTSYINDREYPGNDELPPGPFGYQFIAELYVINILIGLMFPLNQWLADGLLLYRCWVIYFMNYWVIAFTSLLYITSVAVGVMYVYEGRIPLTAFPIGLDADISYYTISVSLNILPTLMIITRLVLHSRNIRSAMGTSAGAGGLYNAVVTMLVESYALYAATYLSYLGLWAGGSHIQYTFTAPLGEIQVIAPFLITLRVANQRALTGDMIYSGNSIGSIRFRGQGESTGDDRTLSEGNHMSPIQMNGETPGDDGVGIGGIIEVQSCLET